MSLDIFKKDNELDQGISIDECKEKIKVILREQSYIDQELINLERQFVAINKENVKRFLTEELNFIINSDSQRDIYSFESEGCKYKIIINFVDFNARSFVNFYTDKNNWEYSFLGEYKNINFSKLYWELEESLWDDSKLKRTDRTVIQDNRKYWNKELKIAEESYNYNNRSFLDIKNLEDKNRFNILVSNMDNTDTEYENLEEFIKKILENIK